MKPLYIFDLDGTLAIIKHRLHHIQKDPKDWRAFFAACEYDEPNWPVIRTMDMLRSVGRGGGAEVWVWSGRSDEVRAQTVAWLTRYTSLTRADLIYPGNELRMRVAGDHAPDEVVKAEWLDRLDPSDRNRIVAVFDDRDRMVRMWRERGFACFQVAEGSF